MKDRRLWLTVAMVVLVLSGLWLTRRTEQVPQSAQDQTSAGCGRSPQVPKTPDKSVPQSVVDPAAPAKAQVVGDDAEGRVRQAPDLPLPGASDTGEPASVRTWTVPAPQSVGGDGEAVPRNPLLTVDARAVAWVAQRSLHVASLDGASLGTVVSVATPGVPRNLTWSSPGALVFEMGGRLHIWRAGQPQTQPLITEVDQPGRLSEPVYSHAGGWLAFVADTHGNGDVHVWFPDSGSIRRLHVTKASEHGLSVSKDGGAVAYVRGDHQPAWTNVSNETETLGPVEEAAVSRADQLADGKLVWLAHNIDHQLLRRVGRNDIARTLEQWPSGEKLDRLSLTPDHRWLVIPSDPQSAADGVVALRSAKGPRQLELQTGTANPRDVHFARRGSAVWMAWVGQTSDGPQVHAADVSAAFTSE